MSISRTMGGLLLAGLFSISIISCKDDDDEDLDVYIQSVEVLNTVSSTGDPFSDADLRVDLKRASVSNYEYSTNVSQDNATLPVTLSFPNEILATQENWIIRLVDDNGSDFPSGDDEEIYTVTFNPTVNINSNDEIILKVNTLDALRINVQQR
ncbi:MAG: hypothetical protein SFW35_06445 [Chitinophagales bacterium]|nr:hypothetical protein [Chitinophagales bacterium]